MRKIWLHIILILFVVPLKAQVQQGINPLNREVTINLIQISKKALLDSIATITNVHFSYNPQLLNAHQVLDINVLEKELYKVLEEITDTKKIAFKAFDNQIVFFPIFIDETKPGKPVFKIISGIVTDKRKGEPLPYCNVAIVGQAIGTITNTEGKFTLKVPLNLIDENLGISCLGYLTQFHQIAKIDNEEQNIQLSKTTFQLAPVNVYHYEPQQVLDSINLHLKHNYDNKYNLYTTYYREVVKQDEMYVDISEAVLEVMKAPYNNNANDHVKFVLGRKSTEVAPFGEIRLKLKGGPYYITMLDVIKNRESFINPEFINFYDYTFLRRTSINGRPTLVISFKPQYHVRDMLYNGKIYVDLKTWGVSRIEFEYTKTGLKESREMLVQKEPKKSKAFPTELKYTVQYKLLDDKWYFLNAQSSLKIKLIDKKNKKRTMFHSISEILTTNVEKGDFQRFSRREIFKPNEFFTDKIENVDVDFWGNYNVIRPEDELIEALEGFENYNLVIQNRNYEAPNSTTE